MSKRRPPPKAPAPVPHEPADPFRLVVEWDEEMGDYAAAVVFDIPAGFHAETWATANRKEALEAAHAALCNALGWWFRPGQKVYREGARPGAPAEAGAPGRAPDAGTGWRAAGDDPISGVHERTEGHTEAAGGVEPTAVTA